MNHRINARLHHYPWCPECEVLMDQPCRVVLAGEAPHGGPNLGAEREPHRTREKIAAGILRIVPVTNSETFAVDLAIGMVNGGLDAFPVRTRDKMAVLLLSGMRAAARTKARRNKAKKATS